MQNQKQGHTPLPWKVRSHPDLGSFVEAKIPGKPYGQEILGDDYFDELSRDADCEFIVRACNHHAELLAALEDVKNTLSVVLESRELDSTQFAFSRIREQRDKLRTAIRSAQPPSTHDPVLDAQDIEEFERRDKNGSGCNG